MYCADATAVPTLMRTKSIMILGVMRSECSVLPPNYLQGLKVNATTYIKVFMVVNQGTAVTAGRRCSSRSYSREHYPVCFRREISQLCHSSR